MSAAVIHVVSFIINPDPRLLASAPLPRTALRRRNWPLETRRWYSQLSSQELSSFSSVFSIYIIYNRPLQSTQANGIANTTQTPQLHNLPRCRTSSVGLSWRSRRLLKRSFISCLRAATDWNWKESIVWITGDTSPLVTVVPLQIQVKDWPL